MALEGHRTTVKQKANLAEKTTDFNETDWTWVAASPPGSFWFTILPVKSHQFQSNETPYDREAFFDGIDFDRARFLWFDPCPRQRCRCEPGGSPRVVGGKRQADLCNRRPKYLTAVCRSSETIEHRPEDRTHRGTVCARQT